MNAVRMTLIIFLLGVVVSGCSDLSGPTAVSAGNELKPNQRFTLMNLKNEAVSLDSVLSKNKAVLINFWATWCGYCVEEMPDLIKLQTRLEAKGFTILAVNVGESSQQVSIFAKKKGLNFPVVLDEDNTVSRNYGLVGIPISYLVRTDGKILGEYHGFSRRLESDAEKETEHA